MNKKTINIIKAFSSLNILVIGDAIMDGYMRGESERLSREAPVPIVEITEENYVGGGAANTASNLASLGAKTYLLSVAGDDKEGEILKNLLIKSGVQTDFLFKQDKRKTLTKMRVVSGSHLITRIDHGSVEQISPETEMKIIKVINSIYHKFDTVVVSDYGYGVLTKSIIDKLKKLKKNSLLPIIVDAKNLIYYQDIGVDAVKPNYIQAINLLGISKAKNHQLRIPQIKQYGQKLLNLIQSKIVAVTLDRDGALIFERDRPAYRTYAYPVPDSNSSGAGDTFTAVFAMALALHCPLATSAELASAAANLSVSEEGTSVCTKEKLIRFFSGNSKYVETREEMIFLTENYKREGKKIVFTNGCFDIIHPGHVTYLSQAKELGDIFIVAVNTDEGVRKLKGWERPINKLEDRINVLSALSSVDHIISFSSDNPISLIEQIKPDIYVKGGDYTRETLPEVQLVESYGGKVYILPYIKNHSTTNIIRKIRRPIINSLFQ